MKMILFICGFLECSNFTEFNFCSFENNRIEYELRARGFFAGESSKSHPEVDDCWGRLCRVFMG